MANVLAVAAPVKVHPHSAIHLETVDNPRAQRSEKFFVVEVRQDSYRTHRRQATVDNLIQNDFLAVASALNTDFIQTSRSTLHRSSRSEASDWPPS